MQTYFCQAKTPIFNVHGFLAFVSAIVLIAAAPPDHAFGTPFVWVVDPGNRIAESTAQTAGEKRFDMAEAVARMLQKTPSDRFSIRTMENPSEPTDSFARAGAANRLSPDLFAALRNDFTRSSRPLITIYRWRSFEMETGRAGEDGSLVHWQRRQIRNRDRSRFWQTCLHSALGERFRSDTDVIRIRRVSAPLRLLSGINAPALIVEFSGSGDTPKPVLDILARRLAEGLHTAADRFFQDTER